MYVDQAAARFGSERTVSSREVPRRAVIRLRAQRGQGTMRTLVSDVPDTSSGFAFLRLCSHCSRFPALRSRIRARLVRWAAMTPA